MFKDDVMKYTESDLFKREIPYHWNNEIAAKVIAVGKGLPNDR